MNKKEYLKKIGLTPEEINQSIIEEKKRDLFKYFYIYADNNVEITSNIKVTYKGKDISKMCVGLVMSKYSIMDSIAGKEE